MAQATRRDDEKLLKVIAMRISTGSARETGLRFGFYPEPVRTMTNRVRDADPAESGENRDEVVKAYQWGKV